MRSRPRVGIVSVAGVVIVCLWASTASAQCYLDTPSGYGRIGGAGRLGPYPSSAACEAVNRQYFGGRGSCSCAASGSPGRGGGASGVDVQQWQIEQEMLRRQREAEDKRRKLEQAEEESRQREQSRDRAFKEGQREAIGTLKGDEADPAVKRAIPFGIKANPDSPLPALKEVDAPARSISTEWKHAHCGMWIAGHAIGAGRKGEVEEVRYLGSQSLRAFSGGPPELRCPDTPAPPDVVGRELTGKDSPIVRFHETVLRAVEREAERIRQADRQILEARLRKQALEAEIKAKEKEARQLEAEVKQTVTPDPAPAQPEAKPSLAPPSSEPPVDPAAEKKKRALAEALAALARAKQAAAETDALAAKAEESKRAADSRLGEYSKLSQQVQASPSQAAELTEKIGN